MHGYLSHAALLVNAQQVSTSIERKLCKLLKQRVIPLSMEVSCFGYLICQTRLIHLEFTGAYSV